MKTLLKIERKKYSKNDFSEFTVRATSSEKKKLILGAIKKANKIQKAIVSQYS